MGWSSPARREAIGALRFNVRPSGANVNSALPLKYPASSRSMMVDPKPLRVGVSTGGPPASVQRKCSSLDATFQVTSTVPTEFESAPYLAALVASSCNANNKPSRTGRIAASRGQRL